MRTVVQDAMNRICRARLERTLPGVLGELKAYAKGSDTTGTQPITLWFAVKSILQHKPAWILESGTGSSTLVLAAAVQKLRKDCPGYQGRVVSMESIPEWHAIAAANLPEKYRDVVEIILGPREKFEMGIFRGYAHSNIPKQDFSFVLLDGPGYFDESGVAFCADVFKVMTLSDAPVIRGVVDGRASSVQVIQLLYGTASARYWHSLYAARFALKMIDFRNATERTPKDYRCSAFGRLEFVKFRQ